MKTKWELITNTGGKSYGFGNITSRLRVPGGWIVNTYTWVDETGCCESSVFIADPTHEWIIE